MPPSMLSLRPLFAAIVRLLETLRLTFNELLDTVSKVDLAAQEGPGAFTTGPREVVGAHLGFPGLGLLEIEAGKAAAQALECGLGSLGVEG